MPSSIGYLLAAVITSAALFFVLWWMLVNPGDEAPWLPAGLAASVVLLVALSAREVVMRRAWTRYLLENGIQGHATGNSKEKGDRRKRGYSSSLHSAALRAIQKQSSAADAIGSSPDSHLDVAQLCHDYLASADEALRSGGFASDKRITLKAGQDRVRALHKHHLLIWARDQSRTLTRDAQQRARTFDKIETANRALECIESALKVYPDEPELKESKLAIGEFIASVKVAHWVELAERSAFKGHYRRAIDRYKDALFYLSDEAVKEEMRTAGTERIQREIEKLRTSVKSGNGENRGRRGGEPLGKDNESKL
jgi:tetratricopeptide (TPR) repeat protein